MAWIYLAIATVLEIIWALTLKTTEGYTRLWPSVINAAIVAANVVVLSKAMKDLPPAAVYAIWVGLGATGVALGSAMIYGESMTTFKVCCIALIVAGVIGLRIAMTPQS